MNDTVNHPAHYCSGGIECIDAIKAATGELTCLEAVCTGNAMKYLWRWKKKNGVEDLRKADWYIRRLIRELEEPPKNEPERAALCTSGRLARLDELAEELKQSLAIEDEEARRRAAVPTILTMVYLLEEAAWHLRVMRHRLETKSHG